MGINLGGEVVFDGSTVCKFRHLLEPLDLGDQLYAPIAKYFYIQENGLKISIEMIVDATIFDVPGWTRNLKGKRD